MAAFSAIMRGMNILLSIAITTGILSGIWGWVAVSLGLLSWAGFLGCTAYFACPQGGLKGLAISAATLLSGVVWAMVIIYGSALAPHLEILGYVITGIVAFLMCIQAKQLLLSFVPGTFIGACATFAGQGDWKLVLPSLALGLIFGYAMKNSGLWLRRVVQRRRTVSRKSKIKREGHSRFRLNSKMPDDNSGFFICQDSGGTDIWRYFTRMSFCRSALFCKSHRPRSIPSLIRKMTPVSIADIRHSITGSFEV
jgi:hypothetical protein